MVALTQLIREQVKAKEIKFLFIAISVIFLGIFYGSRGSWRALPEPICLPTMTQAGREHVMQCIRLVQADALCIAPQRQTRLSKHGLNM